MAVCAGAGALWGGEPAQNIARVREIAAMLPEEPGFPSVRVDARDFWSLAPASAVASGAELLAKPRKKLDESGYTDFKFNARSVSGDLIKLVHAECAENKGRFVPRIVETIDDLCTARTWVPPYHDRPHFGAFHGKYRKIDLGSGAVSMRIAFALDRLKGRLPPATVARAMDRLRVFIVEPYLRSARKGDFSHQGWFFGHSNWNAACHWQSVALALSILPDRMERAEFVEAAERAMPFFLGGFSKEGYCQEGLDYWNYGFGRFLPLVLDVRRATGGKVDLGKLPRAKEAMAYAYGFQLEPFVAPRVSDGMANAPSSLNLALGRLIWPDLTCERAERFNPVIPGFDSLSFLALSDDVSRSRASSDNRVLSLPSRTWFSDAQMYFGRPGGSSRVMPFSACLKGGWNGDPHNHNDVGTYVLMLGGVEMVSDPGGEEYTKRTFSPRRYESKILNSYGHPVPVVAGELQKPGTQYAAQVLDTEFSDAADVVKLDLSRAYGLDDSVKVVRTLRYDRTRRSATISDDFKAGKPIAFETAIITFAAVERTGDPSTFFLVNATPRRKLKVSISAEAGELAFREERLENPKRRIPTRIGVALAGNAKEGSIRIRYDVVE